jgi:hypothetical protein
MRTKQVRSSQYYPSLSILVADVVDASGLRHCGPELSEILDELFTKFSELAVSPDPQPPAQLPTLLFKSMSTQHWVSRYDL